MDKKKRYIFNPALYIQRHEFVLNVLKECLGSSVGKVVDFGCAEGRFMLRLLRNNSKIDHLIGIDNYEPVVEEASQNLQPISADFIFRRTHSLKVDLFSGDCTLPDSRLENIEALTCIELIEHLEPECLDRFPRTVFGILSPKIVIVSTPNKEFNVVLGMEDHEIRHFDHKFEWTRAQFNQWCSDIVRQFPYYTVSFDGVGVSPDHLEVGHSSQFAVFKRNQQNMPFVSLENHSNHLELVTTIDYPYKEVCEDLLNYKNTPSPTSNDEAFEDDSLELSTSLLEDSWFRVKTL